MKNPMALAIRTPMGILAVAAMLLVGAVRAGAQQGGPPPNYGQPPVDSQPPQAPLPPDQLQQLVAPIALYPDALVAQILAGSMYPTQIVEAERFMQQNPNMQGPDLAAAVDQQDWDPSVKALTQFPSVLSDMSNNLSWTSELGDVEYNQQADVMNAIQYMRQQAQQAGNLNSGPQQTVDDNNGEIAIAPANPEVVYVPEYDPEMAFGYPVGLWPGFTPWWSMGTPYLSFGIGFGMGPFMGYGWGWRNWGCGWGEGMRGPMFGGQRYFGNSHAFYDHNAFARGNYRGIGGAGGGQRGFVSSNRAGAFGGGNRRQGFTGSRPGGVGNRPSTFNGGNRGLRGFGARGAPSMRGGAFSGFSRGGDAGAFSARGRSSMGGGFGGGGMRGGFGGGGMRGGGFGGGGMRGGGGGRR